MLYTALLSAGDGLGEEVTGGAHAVVLMCPVQGDIDESFELRQRAYPVPSSFCVTMENLVRRVQCDGGLAAVRARGDKVSNAERRGDARQSDGELRMLQFDVRCVSYLSNDERRALDQHDAPCCTYPKRRKICHRAALVSVDSRSGANAQYFVVLALRAVQGASPTRANTLQNASQTL